MPSSQCCSNRSGKRSSAAVARSTARSTSAIEQRQHRFGEPREVPLRDRRLVAVGVSPAVVDRAEHRRGIVGVHERARAVVDRFAGERHVVGVHHAVDEADQLPAGDQARLPFEDRLEQREVRLRRIGELRVVSRPRVVRERPQGLAGRRVPRPTAWCRRGCGSRPRASAPRPGAPSRDRPARPSSPPPGCGWSECRARASPR